MFGGEQQFNPINPEDDNLEIPTPEISEVISLPKMDETELLGVIGSYIDDLPDNDKNPDLINEVLKQWENKFGEEDKKLLIEGNDIGKFAQMNNEQKARLAALQIEGRSIISSLVKADKLKAAA